MKNAKIDDRIVSGVSIIANALPDQEDAPT